MVRKLSRRPAAFGVLAGLLVAAAAQADVTIENTISVEGVGMMAVGNMSGTTRTSIAGDKSRTDSTIQMKSRLVRMLAHNATGPSAEIVRLDDDKIYHLNINKKEYTETTFEQMRSNMNAVTNQPEDSGQKEQQTPSAIDESKCEWLPPKVDVNKTGEKAQIAGYDAERVTITAVQPCKDKQTGSICEIALGLDEWLTTGFAESSEAQKFHKAYAAKLGLDISKSQDVAKRAQAMFGRYKGVWSEIATKMQGTKGYPVKSAFTLALGGEQCQNANARQGQSGTSESSPPASPSALASQMAGKLGTFFKKKKDESAEASAPAPDAALAARPPVPPGDVPLLTVSSQLMSVSTNPVNPDVFLVPPDFKRQELPARQEPPARQ